MKLVEVPYLFLMAVFPLIGAIYSGLFGARLHRRFGEPAVWAVSATLPWLSFIVAATAFVQLAGAGPHAAVYQRLWTWFEVGSLNVNLAFIVDRLSAVMCLIVTFVGSLIHVYSAGYMHRDDAFWRFFAYLNLFLFSMLILVLGDSLLLAFVGWEGVGLCSYLLIGFWYKDPNNASAGMKAFIVNRVGDAGFILGMFTLFWGLGPGVEALRGPLAGAAAADVTAESAACCHGGEARGEHGAVVHASTPPEHGPPSGAAPQVHEASGHGAAEHGATEHGATEHGATEHAGAAHGGEHVAQAPDYAAVGPLPARSLEFRELERIVALRAGVDSRAWGGVSILTIAALLLFVGAMGKSAQIPLYVWLPDAMAGPTPVSALIHAATMVTAGVYLVARMHFVYAASPVAMTVVTTVGAVTALFAATIGLFQYDIKKVLAYSTVSQLGFMFVAVGVGAYWVGIFHLMTHAFFKACLFLGSGSVILGCHHEQDMRKMGGLAKLMPITAWTYLLSCFAIAGFPPFSGFFSKDEILWKAFDSGNLLLPGGGLIPWALTTAAALCTSFYMFRSYFMTFSGSYRGNAADAHGPAPESPSSAASDNHWDEDEALDAHGHGAHGHDAHAHDAHDAHAHGHHGGLPHESPASMTYVLMVLAALAVAGGYVGLPLLWGLPNWFEAWLEPVFAGSHHLVRSAHHGHGMEWGLMGLSVVVGVTGFLLARWLYLDGKSPLPQALLDNPNPTVRFVHRLVFNKYYVDELYQATFVRGLTTASRALFWFDANVIDGIVNLCGTVGRLCGELQGFIDRVFVDGLVNLVGDGVIRGGRELRRVQTGQIQLYVYAALTGSVVLILIVYAVQW